MRDSYDLLRHSCRATLPSAPEHVTSHLKRNLALCCGRRRARPVTALPPARILAETALPPARILAESLDSENIPSCNEPCQIIINTCQCQLTPSSRGRHVTIVRTDCWTAACMTSRLPNLSELTPRACEAACLLGNCKSFSAWIFATAQCCRFIHPTLRRNIQ